MDWFRTTMDRMGSGRVDPHTEDTRHMRDRGYTAMGVPVADVGPLPVSSESELVQNYPEDVGRHDTEYANHQYAGVDIPRKYADQATDIQHADEPVQYELTETGERDAEVGAAWGKARDLAPAVRAGFLGHSQSPLGGIPGGKPGHHG